MLDKLPGSFITYASEVLGDTQSGLTGTQIVKYSNSYAVDFGVDIPISTTDWGEFGKLVPNKRTALQRNLAVFNGQQQFAIIKELCELPEFSDNAATKDLKAKLIERYSSFSPLKFETLENEPTGWERVDRAIDEMKKRLEVADNEEKYQAIGMIGRETLITIAQQVFRKDEHPSIDGTDIGPTDAKRMLEAFVTKELELESNKFTKWAKASVDLSNQLTHDRTATKVAASLCLVAVSNIAAMAKIINDK